MATPSIVQAGGSTVARRQEVLLRRRSHQNIRNSVRRLDRQQDMLLRDLDRVTTKIRDEEATSRTHLSNMSTYFDNNDFKKLTTDITEEEHTRRHFNRILDRQQPTSHGICIHGRSCDAFPCQRIQSYHFMFRQVKVTNQVQTIDLIRRPADTNDLTKLTGTNDKHNRRPGFSRAKTVSVLPSNSVDMNRKEVLLRCAVLRRRLADSDRKFVVRAVNYGDPIPWRALKKPAMLEQTYGTVFGDNKRLLTFNI